MYRIVFIISIFLCIKSAKAQDIKVAGRFLQDTIKIGEATPYALSARYPKEKTAVFPDDNYDFGIFELEDKRYFSTRTIGNTSIDSAIYYLSTFEIDSVLYYQLPVNIYYQKDTITIYPAYDSVFIKQLVQFVPDSVSAQALPLLVNTTYYRVRKLFNTPLVIISSIVLIGSIVLVWVLFGKRIRTYFKIRKLKKQYNLFLQKFDAGVYKLEQQKNLIFIEEVVSTWKKYLEQISNIPFTKLTSKEILHNNEFKELQQPLRYLDFVLYAGQNFEDMGAFMKLKNFAGQLFEKRLQEIEGGKR